LVELCKVCRIGNNAAARYGVTYAARSDHTRTTTSESSDETTECSITTDIEKANSECCVYCSYFGFDEDDRREKQQEQNELLADWSNPVDLASPLDRGFIAANVGLSSPNPNTLMRHAWLQHEAKAPPKDDDDCCVICPYSPTALHVYAVTDDREGTSFRRCCPACPTQFILLLSNYSTSTSTSGHQKM